MQYNYGGCVLDGKIHSAMGIYYLCFTMGITSRIRQSNKYPLIIARCCNVCYYMGEGYPLHLFIKIKITRLSPLAFVHTCITSVILLRL